tara:strand:+ start:57 stop:206 length:150 start_codon:yes stop_codon:yes gene_type:complete
MINTDKDEELIKLAPEILAAIEGIRERVLENIRKSKKYHEMLLKREAEE